MAKGGLQRVRLWLSARKKSIIWILIVIAVLCSVFYLWLRFFFFFGDDLIMQFDANQSSFRITNAGRAPVTVAISTQNQILCDAVCTLQLENISTKLASPPEEFTLRPKEGKQENFSLVPGNRGTGQEIYSVTASCHNVASFLCPTSSPERRKSILLTVNYGLTADESAMKPQAQETLLAMMLALRDADLLVHDATAATGTFGLPAQALIVNLTRAEQEYSAANVFIETCRKMWTEESYTALYAILRNSTITAASINATGAEAQSIVDAAQGLVDEHNSLRDVLENVRSDAKTVIASSPVGLSDPLVGPQLQRVADASDGLTRDYVDGNITSVLAFVDRESLLAEMRRNLSAAIDARLPALVSQGNARIVAQEQALCASNVTCFDFNNATNVTSNLTALSDVCAKLRTILAYNQSNATDAQNYVGTVCSPLYPTMNLDPLLPIALAVPANRTSDVDIALSENLPQCCVFGKCGACCNTAQCRDDPATYPVVFVHGHSFNSGNSPEYSLGGYFQGIQRKLQTDGYLDAGIITPSSTFDEAAPGEWGLSGRPVTARVTYYYNFYKNGADYVLITQKSESIETYAIRLKEMVDIVKHHTGKQKVDIVAHSMGGLVVRRYLQLFGEDSVNKVILIATPDNGISGSTLRYCPVLGANKECADMANDSVFMRKLNDAANQPTAVKFVTIAGRGCDVDGKDGDGVMSVPTVQLPFATNYVVNGTCPDLFHSDLHTELLNIAKYPLVYDIIKQELES